MRAERPLQILVLHTGNNYYNSSVSDLYAALRKLTHGRESYIRVVDVNAHHSDLITATMDEARVICADQYLFNASQHDPLVAGYSDFSVWRGLAHYRTIAEAFLKRDCLRAIHLSHWDPHVLPFADAEFSTKRVLAAADCLFWQYEQLLSYGLSPVGPMDPWMAEFSPPEENLRLVAQLSPMRVDLPMVTPAEPPTDIGRWRPFDAAVPGQLYGSRQQALISAKQSGLNVYPFRQLNSSLVHSVGRLRRPRARRLLDRTRARNYYAAMRLSQACWVDGSTYRYPVRKFFEASWLGSLMITSGFPGMQDYGFAEGKTHLECRPEDFGCFATQMIGSRSRSDRIIRACVEALRRLHTPEARADQMLMALGKLLNQGSCRGRFEDGEFAVSVD